MNELDLVLSGSVTNGSLCAFVILLKTARTGLGRSVVLKPINVISFLKDRSWICCTRRATDSDRLPRLKGFWCKHHMDDRVQDGWSQHICWIYCQSQEFCKSSKPSEVFRKHNHSTVYYELDTGCPGRLWSLLLWRYSRPAWTRSSAACCRWPCFGRGLDWVTHRGPFQPLLFCDSVNLLSNV